MEVKDELANFSFVTVFVASRELLRCVVLYMFVLHCN